MIRLAFAWLVGALVAFAMPLAAAAFPFGGQINQFRPCFNEAIFARIGPPVAGPYIWTPSTRTYTFGPPRNTGQWLLGLASAPYYCIVSIMPVDVWPGTAITMMGSSQPGGGGGLPQAPSRPTTPDTIICIPGVNCIVN